MTITITIMDHWVPMLCTCDQNKKCTPTSQPSLKTEEETKMKENDLKNTNIVYQVCLPSFQGVEGLTSSWVRSQFAAVFGEFDFFPKACR